jgi:hypothetical protein
MKQLQRIINMLGLILTMSETNKPLMAGVLKQVKDDIEKLISEWGAEDD